MGQPFADWPPDDKILSLFRDWIVAQNDAHALGQLKPDDDTPEKAEFDAACARIDELAWSIADIPSHGPIGLAIKADLRQHVFPHGGRPESLGEFDVDCSQTALEQSIIQDAVRFVPELGPLAAAVVGSGGKAAA
jgi:hypothetical protein